MTRRVKPQSVPKYIPDEADIATNRIKLHWERGEFGMAKRIFDEMQVKLYSGMPHPTPENESLEISEED